MIEKNLQSLATVGRTPWTCCWKQQNHSRFTLFN